MNRAFNHVVCGYLSRLWLALLMLASFTVDARASEQGAEAKGRTPDVEVMLAGEHVRFRVADATAALRLEVFNQTGEPVYDSGEGARTELLWDLKDADDKPLRAGLYAYTLTVKRGENEVAGKRRGHLIVEQTGSRFWLTSQGGVGVEGQDNGTVISGTSDGTVAGVNVPRLETAVADPNTEGPASEIAPKSKGNADGSKGGTLPPVPLVVNGTGTAGQIPKWTTTTNIGNSVITESTSGQIGIGTTVPTAKLEVSSNLAGAGAGAIKGINPSTGYGVFGLSLIGAGVVGDGGFWGVSGRGHIGVYGTTTSSDPNSAGVGGSNFGGVGPGVAGDTTSTEANAVGVLGRVNATNAGTNSAGVLGVNNGTGREGIGVMGTHAGAGWGVYGDSPNGRGVYGTTANGTGVYGRSQTNIGVEGRGPFGLFGMAEGSADTYGLYTHAPSSGWAAYLDGRVIVNGTLSKAGGSFKIDHPLDPENKYLYHSFVESPDMKNIYDGTVTTDENGEAVVTLPEWFEALNRDFRYQLTVIGQFAQAIVAGEIKENRFRIKTSAPQVKVSWQVTGIRQDAWANKNRIPVEEAKPESERGSYLHPEVFGKAEETNVMWKLHPEMMKRSQAEHEKNKAETGKPQP